MVDCEFKLREMVCWKGKKRLLLFLCCWKPMLMGHDCRYSIFFTVVALNLKDVLGYTCVNYLFALHVIVSQFCWFDVFAHCFLYSCIGSFSFCWFWFVEFYALPVFYVFVICGFQCCVLTWLNVEDVITVIK